MDGTTILTTASSLLETHGENAKFHIAQKMDDAMLTGDGKAYDDWCMVAKAVNLMTLTRVEAKAAKPEPMPLAARTFKAA